MRGVSADTPSLLDKVTYGMKKSEGSSILFIVHLASFGVI